MSNISEKILDEISSKHLKPRNKRYFVLREIAFWGMTFVFIVLGSFLFSAILYKVFEGNLVQRFLPFGPMLERVLRSVPVFWFFALLAFIILSFFNYKCTKRSYKHRKRYVLILSGMLMITLGAILYYFNVGEGVCTLISYGVRLLV